MITAVIKAKNEADRIAAAILSARLVADIVLVIDDASSDNTVAIAESTGARVIAGVPHHGSIDLLDRQGFEEVREGWILRMDADERVTPELARRLRAISGDEEASGARYARLNYMFGGGARHGGWFDPHQLGFFRFDAWDRTWGAEMHTQVPVFGQIHTVLPSDAFMEHFDYENIGQFVDRTLLRYASAEAAEMFARGVRFRKRKLLIGPFLRLWGRYVVRNGYRDGHRGLVLAALLGAYDIVRWSMLWELEKNNGKDL